MIDRRKLWAPSSDCYQASQQEDLMGLLHLYLSLPSTRPSPGLNRSKLALKAWPLLLTQGRDHKFEIHGSNLFDQRNVKEKFYYMPTLKTSEWHKDLSLWFLSLSKNQMFWQHWAWASMWQQLVRAVYKTSKRPWPHGASSLVRVWRNSCLKKSIRTHMETGRSDHAELTVNRKDIGFYSEYIGSHWSISRRLWTWSYLHLTTLFSGDPIRRLLL